MFDRKRLIEGITVLNESGLLSINLVVSEDKETEVLINEFITSVEYIADVDKKEDKLPKTVVNVYNEISDFILALQNEEKESDIDNEDSFVETIKEESILPEVKEEIVVFKKPRKKRTTKPKVVIPEVVIPEVEEKKITKIEKHNMLVEEIKEKIKIGKKERIHKKIGTRSIVRKMLREGRPRTEIRDAVVNRYVNDLGKDIVYAKARFACIYYEMALELGLEKSAIE